MIALRFGEIFPATVPLSHYLLFSAILFAIGLYGVLARRNAVGMLLSIELMLNAVNVNLAAFSRSGLPDTGAVPAQIVGQLFVIFLITVAVAEAAVGLAIIVAIFKLRKTVLADELTLLRG